MDHKLNDRVAYSIADILQIPIDYDKVTKLVTGSVVKKVDLNGLEVSLNPTIVSSNIGGSRTDLLVHVIGDLHLILTYSVNRCRIYFVDASKFDGDLVEECSDGFDDYHDKIVKFLGPALTRCFESQTGSDTWGPAKESKASF